MMTASIAKSFALTLDSTRVQSGLATSMFGCPGYADPPKDFDVFMDDDVIAPAR